MDETRDFNAAKKSLEQSLLRYSAAIRSLRSYHQHTTLSGQSEETERIRAYVENSSNRTINCENSGLFAIELDIGKIGRRYTKEDPARYDAIIRGVYDSHGLLPAHVKGFWFMLYGEVFDIDCMVLDRGLAADVFDSFDIVAKQQLATEFSRKRKNPETVRTSKKYAAFVTQPDTDKFIVETFVDA